MKKILKKTINGIIWAIHVFLILGSVGCIRNGYWIDAGVGAILLIITIVVYALLNKNELQNENKKETVIICPFCKGELELPNGLTQQKVECGYCGNKFVTSSSHSM
jgi:uncharacterized Zn-finger protein